MPSFQGNTKLKPGPRKNEPMITSTAHSMMNMVKITSISMDYDSLVSKFAKHGPIFTSVQKNWNGNDYAHAVVMCGVADTGVFIDMLFRPP